MELGCVGRGGARRWGQVEGGLKKTREAEPLAGGFVHIISTSLRGRQI
jgi:hypothetical protein